MRAWDRVLLLAPHPDDETLGAGGLLQQAVAAGAAVRIVFATDGENNPWAQRAVERRWRLRPADRVRWGHVRRGEALDAVERLGVSRDDVTFLGLPDQGLTAMLLDDANRVVATLARTIARDLPTVVVAPTPFDLHPDHSALAVLTRFAIRRLVPAARRPLVLEYLVHGRRASTGAIEPCWQVRLSADQIIRKRAAIRAHASQLVLRRRGLLAFATPRERFYAPQCLGVDPLDDAHPIRTAWVDGQTLRLRVRQHAHLGAFGRTTLYVAIEHRDGSTCWRTVLPRAANAVECVRLFSGMRVVPAVSEPCPGGRDLRLPLGIFRGARAIVAKLERRFGFFDEAGWCELAVTPPIPREAAALRAALRGERRPDEVRPLLKENAARPFGLRT